MAAKDVFCKSSVLGEAIIGEAAIGDGYGKGAPILSSIATCGESSTEDLSDTELPVLSFLCLTGASNLSITSIFSSSFLSGFLGTPNALNQAFKLGFAFSGLFGSGDLIDNSFKASFPSSDFFEFSSNSSSLEIPSNKPSSGLSSSFSSLVSSFISSSFFSSSSLKLKLDPNPKPSLSNTVPRLNFGLLSSVFTINEFLTSLILLGFPSGNISSGLLIF